MDEALLSTAFGTIKLISYLPTRTFELAVHSLDIIRATDIGYDLRLEGPISEACALAGTITSRDYRPRNLLAALTGRSSYYPEGLSVGYPHGMPSGCVNFSYESEQK